MFAVWVFTNYISMATKLVTRFLLRPKLITIKGHCQNCSIIMMINPPRVFFTILSMLKINCKKVKMLSG